nr:MAG TPA: ammonia monooxygenase subunt A [Caudoviricetes sp.]DAQ50766.1 MAG TPA: ammonia monooxygenase subunt A [Caudoviricetes sp.]
MFSPTNIKYTSFTIFSISQKYKNRRKTFYFILTE